MSLYPLMEITVRPQPAGGAASAGTPTVGGELDGAGAGFDDALRDAASASGVAGPSGGGDGGPATVGGDSGAKSSSKAAGASGEAPAEADGGRGSQGGGRLRESGEAGEGMSAAPEADGADEAVEEVPSVALAASGPIPAAAAADEGTMQARAWTGVLGEAAADGGRVDGTAVTAVTEAVGDGAGSEGVAVRPEGEGALSLSPRRGGRELEPGAEGLRPFARSSEEGASSVTDGGDGAGSEPSPSGVTAKSVGAAAKTTRETEQGRTRSLAPEAAPLVGRGSGARNSLADMADLIEGLDPEVSERLQTAPLGERGGDKARSAVAGSEKGRLQRSGVTAVEAESPSGRDGRHGAAEPEGGEAAQPDRRAPVTDRHGSSETEGRRGSDRGGTSDGAGRSQGGTEGRGAFAAAVKNAADGAPVPAQERSGAGRFEAPVSLRTDAGVDPPGNGAAAAAEGRGVEPSAPREGSAPGAAAGRIQAHSHQIFEDIRRGLSVSVGRGLDRVRMTLHPEHLGKLDIKLSVDGDGVSARIMVTSHAVKGLLDADASRLRDAFGAHGMELRDYSVEVDSRGAHDPSGRELPGGRGGMGRRDGRADGVEAVSDAPAHFGPPSRSRIASGRGLDIFV